MNLHDFLIFASDAEQLAALGVFFVAVAILAMTMDRRRMQRGNIDRVGWMPWTGLFLFFAVTGAGMLALAIPPLITGSSS